MLLLLRLGDVTVAVGAWVLAYLMHVAGGKLGWLRPPTHSFPDLINSLVLSLVLAMLVFSRLGLYEPKRIRNLIAEATSVLQAVLLVWVITFAVTSFASTHKLSRATMGLVLANWMFLGLVNRLSGRICLRWFRRRGWNARYAAIVGTGRLGQRLYHVLKTNKWTGIQVRYFVGTGQGRKDLLGLKVLAPMDEIDSLVAQNPVDIVFVALPGQQRDRIEQALTRLAMTNVDVRLVPDLLSFHFLKHDVDQLDELPVITLTHHPQHGWNSVMKRAFDMIGAIVGLIIFALPMGAVALLIKYSSRGGIFYTQKRTSLGGKTFTIIKFRTMVPDAETHTGPVWAESNDSRVTWIGRFLRRTSLDEIPQLLNVLLGQMSLVGPRPERPELIERFRNMIPRYMLRSQVKAGITGWAQVHGLRGQSSLRKRVQYDLYYISNWSLVLDLWILLLSLFRGFVHPNAR